MSTRLNEFDRIEFADKTRRLWPAGYTQADFDAAWDRFVKLKADYIRKMGLQ